MKKFSSIFFVFIFILFVCSTSLTSGPIIAIDTSSLKYSEITCDINSAWVKLDNKDLGVQTLVFNAQLYFPLSDGCYYFNAGYNYSVSNKTIDILSKKNSNIKKISGVKLVTEKNKKVNAAVNPFKVTYNGFDEYLDTLVYNNIVYVPVKYFSEIFDRKIVADSKSIDSLIITKFPIKVIGEVNDYKITQREMDYYLSTSDTQSSTNATKEIFDNLLVIEKISNDKVKDYNISLSQDDIDSANKYIATSVKQAKEIGQLRMSLAMRGVYFNQFVEDVRKSTLFNKLYEKVTSQISPTETELVNYYNQNKESFNEPEKVKVKQIFISTKDKTGNIFSSTQTQEAMKKAQGILDSILKGEDFDTLMKKYSGDAVTNKLPNGMFIARGQTMKPFEDAAFSLPVGDTTKVLIQTEAGFHIIKVVDRTSAIKHTYNEVKSAVKEKAGSESKKKYYDSKLMEWKGKFKVVCLLK
jgi:parvulin-like peptidyl-prolyl isomerase